MMTTLNTHRGLIVPQHLYDEESFGPLAAALNTLAESNQQVERARAADDHADVDDLWGN
ncbi:MAG: hypothetical protein LBJ02_06655 [Bifidobacteriaceae bacterium]|jgi:hypothetical protein|nr:hypothetical protein [Bifidobacteriaceae bacterium]